MDDFVYRKEEADAVPFWERANIRPRELAALKLRVKDLEGLVLSEEQLVALIEVLEECQVLTAKLWLEGYPLCDLNNGIRNMITLCKKVGVE